MVSEEINKVIDKVADKLGVAVENLKPLAGQLVKEYQLQAVIAAISCGVFSLVLVGLSFYLWVRFAKAMKEPPELETRFSDRQSGRAAASAISGGILGLVGTIIFFCGAIENLRRACAPTYYILMDMLANAK